MEHNASTMNYDTLMLMQYKYAPCVKLTTRSISGSEILIRNHEVSTGFGDGPGLAGVDGVAGEGASGRRFCLSRFTASARNCT
jgi:hypothetical protein